MQEKAIPVILRGVHALIVAPTGSGKTEAAFLPVLSKLIELRGVSGVKAVYITPLRSLNRDLFRRLQDLAAAVGVSIYVRHGDSTERERREVLRSPKDVLVMTPESFYFMLSVGRFREQLKELRYVIIDEFHELLDDERGAELMLALERAARYSRRRIQRIGISATLPDAREALRVLTAGRYGEVVEVKLEKPYEISVEMPKPTTADEELSAKLGAPPETCARLRRIVEYVEKARGGVLLFTNTRDTAELLGALLSRLLPEGSVAVHHSSLSRSERLRVEEAFRRGEVKLLIATSSLELGIDIGHVRLVLQYMSPRQAMKLLQRVGRSGHRLGETSRGVVLVAENLYDALESVVLAARAERGDLEPLVLPRSPLDALLHQIAGYVVEKGEVPELEPYSDASSLPYWASLSDTEYYELIDYAQQARIISRGRGVLGKSRRTINYYYSVTMIPDTRQFEVLEYSSRRRIGVLDEEFVASLEEGMTIVLAGRLWRVVGIGDGKVYVAEAEPGSALIPAWEGDMIPVDWRAAREVASLIRRVAELGDLPPGYPADNSLREYVKARIREQARLGFVPSDREVVVELIGGDTMLVHVFGGSRGNRAIELALAELARSFYGYSPATGSTPYGVVAKFTRRLSPEEARNLVEKLAGMSEGEIEALVRAALSRSGLFDWRLMQVARKMGAIDRDAELNKSLLRRLRGSIVGEEAARELLTHKISVVDAVRALEPARRGRLRVVEVKEPSPLARELLSQTRMGAAVEEGKLPATILAEAYRRRLASKQVKLICLLCGYTWERSLASLDEHPSCPKCGARLVAPLPSNVDAARVRELIRRRDRRSKELRKLLEAANLVLSYGRRAVEALAVPGVGVQQARQALQALARFGEEAFYRELAKAEQRFLQTYRYWRSRRQ